MFWIIIIAAVCIALLLFKLVVKPLLKLAAILALAIIVWLLLTNFL